MAVDTTELSTLTNPRFAGIIGEAIRGVRIDERPSITLNDLLRRQIEGNKYSPNKGDIVFHTGKLDRISLRHVGSDGSIAFSDVLGGCISEVLNLAGNEIVGFKIEYVSGGIQFEVGDNSVNNWLPVGLIGRVDGSKLVLNPDLKNGLIRKQTSEEVVVTEEKLGNLKSFLRGPSMFGNLSGLVGISRNQESFSEAVRAFEAYKESTLSKILGGRSHINATHLIPGQAIAYDNPLASKSNYQLLVFDGITEPGTSERYFCYRYVRESDPNRVHVISLSDTRHLVPYGDATYYLGAGQVYGSFDAMQKRYDELAKHVVDVNMKIKQLFAQHLGWSLQEAQK